jgi:hypothetical protein
MLDLKSGYVDRLTELGGLQGRGDGRTEQDIHQAALLYAWEKAGLSPESILAAVRQGELSFSFLETPGWTLPERPDHTYRELSEEAGLPLSFVLDLHEAIGFQSPSPGDRVRQEDLVMLELARVTLEAGRPKRWHVRSISTPRTPAARHRRGRAVSGRDGRTLRKEGMTEADLMRLGSQLGRRTAPLVQQTLLGI